MSKVKITGDASGTGVFTIAAPDSDETRTLTLPDAAGTLLTSDGDGSSLTGITTGKVLAIHHNTSDFGSTTISGTNNTWTDTAVTITFTPTTTASKFLVYYGFGTSTQDSGTDGGFARRVKRVQDATTVYPAFLGDFASGNHHSSYYANSQNDTPARWNIYNTFTGVDAESHTTSSVTYTVQVGQYNITTLNVGNYYSAKAQIIVLEVSTS